ncbi:hypothetical protein CORC01_05955 [Colletotrichum orchidophilum]|uniref:Uncharacterized protein n=1 Tax=Colletotrichum orchidophilum TaxID=1209926 RepID=A0A1G4BB94_9PEZI|nr:uncharacterized protein CORC01_05955 [Colletotrichum orchidophilum]OHE98689.1 hypothetical protein CORC01_05955 [Colletotrichum orchidophilum]
MADQQEPIVTPASGYESFIYIYNKTKVDFALDRSKAILGSWAKGCPPNTIKAGGEALVQLNDSFGTRTAFLELRGEVVYELYHPSDPDTPLSFNVEFCDPYGKWNDNYLRTKSSNPKLVSCQVLDYPLTGHPFTGISLSESVPSMPLLMDCPGHVEVYLAENSASDKVFSGEDLVTQVAPRANSDVRAAFEIGFNGPFGIKIRDPVHEDIAIAAFITSKIRFPKGTEYTNLDATQWEYMRGLLWSDDPLCLLFNDSRESNSELALGDKFLADFYAGAPSSLTQRSHFGDLQFFHAMAAQSNEDPHDTKANMLSWLEIIYKLAIGVQDVRETDSLAGRFPTRFSSSSDPSGDASLRQLFLGRTPSYRKINISKRAFGHCLHMVQDSYAVGHTLRRLSNSGDLDGKDDEGFVRFKPGKFARLGPIITFHTYSGQSKRHAHYDESKQPRNPRDLDSFNHIIGARDAIEKSIKLINFYAQKTKWEDGVRGFLANEVFVLDPNATLSNPQVDERFGLPETSGQSTLEADRLADEEYQLGMERKMAMLEGGLAFAEHVPSGRRPGCLGQLPHRFTGLLFMFAKFLFAFVGISCAIVLGQYFFGGFI